MRNLAAAAILAGGLVLIANGAAADNLKRFQKATKASMERSHKRVSGSRNTPKKQVKR